MNDRANRLRRSVALLLDARWGAAGSAAEQRDAAAAEATVLADAVEAMRPLIGAQDAPGGLAEALRRR